MSHQNNYHQNLLCFQAPESLRITVGNDQFRERKEETSGRLSPSVGQRLGPPKDNYEHGRDAVYRREDDMMYRREAEMYGQPERDRFERDRGHERRDPYSRDPYARPEEREYGDRRGLGGGGYEKMPVEYHGAPQPLFPSASRSSPPRNYPSTQPAGPSPAQTSTASRPLKSILKKKSEPVPEQKPQEKPGLPGIANYMDDIEDEDKFLYGGEDDRRNSSERDRGEGGQYRQHGMPMDDMRAPNIRSAAQSWQPSAPEKSVSGVVSDFINAQREYVDRSKQQHYGGEDAFQMQPMQQSAEPSVGAGGNDLWSMLAKSVQTAQQQQQPLPNQFEPQLGSYQPPFNSQSAQPSYPSQPVQEAQAPAQAGHDPTIENILKSIGFDFEMSKRMQEKAKQSTGEVVPQSAKPGDPKFINQTASFIGSQMSHEEMLSNLQRERDAQTNMPERQAEPIHDDFRERERDRDMFSDRDRRGSSEASRGRMNSPPRRTNSPPRRLNSPPRGQSPERLQRGCSPVSAEGSPPPPMFNLPPITIKRRSNFDRKGSPGWDRKSLSRSPTRDSDRSRNRPRSRSPSWNRSLSSQGRKRSRSPVRKHSLSPVSPVSNRARSRSPGGRKSPVIKRTFNLDDLSPAFRRRVSPSARKRSLSPGRRRSPGRRSLSRGRSPGRRRSRSPYRKRRGSRSPGRRRSRSPRRPSPRGRRRSLSPRGRKRGPSSRSRSRDRKVRRSNSRDRSYRGSPGRHRRSSSRDRNRRRSRSRSLNHSRSPRKGRSLSVSSDSDIDGPANKQYFSSPLRLSRSEKQNIPRYYDYSPQQGPPGPPPFPGFVPGPGPPPGAFPPGSQPGMVQVCPPGPPMFSVPPPGMAPPIGPPPGFPFPPPGPGGPPGGVFAMPGPPVINQPPPITPDADMAPPGTMEMPLNIPNRSNLTEIVNEDTRDDLKRDSEIGNESKRKERSRSRERRGRSRSRERRERSRSRERRDRSRSRERRNRPRSIERSKDRRDIKKSDKSSSSSSNRTVLPPKTKPKAEDIEIKASTTSNERVVVIGGKTAKLPPASEENKGDTEKERLKILKEKDSMIAKIKALEIEFNNLKKQEFDLKKKSAKDSRPDPILVENKKLLDEIKKEIVKLNKQKSDFESKHSVLLKKEQPPTREIKVTSKKTPSKDDKGKAADKKEKEVVFILNISV